VFESDLHEYWGMPVGTYHELPQQILRSFKHRVRIQGQPVLIKVKLVKL
jgi:hypothetical protein